MISAYISLGKYQTDFVHMICTFPTHSLTTLLCFSFRGACPGNFDRLRELYPDVPGHTIVQEETLIQNYRSSANILLVATKFLEGDTSRQPKVLQPTKDAGLPVEVWRCENPKVQVNHIISSIMKRHDEDGIPYSEMACLFRCVNMGIQGNLTTNLQKELILRRIPYLLVGGKSLFERETVLDLMAYLRLLISIPDDDSFKRVMNKPSRRLPNNKVVPILEEQVKRSSTNGSKISLREAAVLACQNHIGLSDSQHKALMDFLAQLKQYSSKVHTESLPDLLKFLWQQTKLQDYHAKKKKREKDKKEEKKKVIIKGLPKPAKPKSKTSEEDTSRYYPEEITSLIELAKQHISDWKQREEELLAQSKQSVRHLLAPSALGKSVILDFLACAALQQSVEDEDPVEEAKDKLIISTVHRAKGLEWSDVYVPYFNQIFMPTEYRSDNETDEEKERQRGDRHLHNCDAKEGGRCTQSCSRILREMEDRRLGGTAEERHLNEERRIAHVAATRAKDKLVFTMFRHQPRNDAPKAKESIFLGELRQLPDSVFKVVNK